MTISRLLSGAVAAAVASAATAGPALGQSRASLEAYTGQLTTPSAWTAEAGTAHLLFTDAEEARFRDTSSSRSWAVTLGFFRYLEGGGRLSEVSPTPAIRDLSLHFKARLPLDLLAPDLPLAVAVGSQDEFGAAPHYRARYAVGSARLWRLGGSVGYGLGPDRLNGWFAGGTLALADGLELVGDWDGADLNAGARAAVSLARLGVPIRVGGIVKTALRHRSPEWGLTVEVPLWLNAGPSGRSAPPVKTPSARPPAAAADPRPARIALASARVTAFSSPAPTPPPPLSTPAPSPSAPPPPPPGAAATSTSSAPPAVTTTPAATAAGAPSRPQLLALEAALVDVGLEEVRVGRDGETVVVEYENSLYNHDEADALYVVLRQVEWAGLASRPLAIVTKRNGLRVAEISVRGAVPGAAADASPRWRSGPAGRHAAWASPSPRNRRSLHSTLVLAPGLRTFVGTEFGVLDYLVTFRPDLIVPFWPGATGFARAELPLAWSDDLDSGRYFRKYRNKGRIEYAMVHQAVRLAPGLWAMVGGGVFQATDAGGVGEALWSGLDGALALGVQGSWTVNDQHVERRALTGSGRLRVAPLDVTVLVRAGRFVSGDRGAAVELSRWFGDTQVGVFYTRTEAAIAGAFFTVPLTFRRDMRPGWLQVRGPRRWGHSLGTRVGDERNTITDGLAVAPVSPWNLESCYLDYGRISSDGLVAPVRGLPALSR